MEGHLRRRCCEHLGNLKTEIALKALGTDSATDAMAGAFLSSNPLLMRNVSKTIYIHLKCWPFKFFFGHTRSMGKFMGQGSNSQCWVLIARPPGNSYVIFLQSQLVLLFRLRNLRFLWVLSVSVLSHLEADLYTLSRTDPVKLLVGTSISSMSKESQVQMCSAQLALWSWIKYVYSLQASFLSGQMGTVPPLQFCGLRPRLGIAYGHSQHSVLTSHYMS